MDKDGKLSPQELQKIAEFFRAKFPEGVACPMCHNKKTVFGEYMLVPLHYGAGGVNMAPQVVYPQIFLICTVCNHFMYFGAGVIGLLGSPPEPPKALSLSDLPRLPGGLYGK